MRDHPFRESRTAQEALEMHFSSSSGVVATGVSVAEGTPLPTGRPFPRILGEGAASSSSTSALTTWRSGATEAGGFCRSLAERAGKVRVNGGRLHRFSEAGLEEDELREVVEGLEATADCYFETDLM